MEDDLFIKEGKELIIPEKKELTIDIAEVKKSVLKKYIDKNTINFRLQEVTNSKDRIFITFLWMTGTRVSEAINVKKQDIKWEDGFIRIKWLKNRKYYERLIPMHDQLKSLMWLYTSPIKAESIIFPFTRQNADRITKKWLGCSPHKLRHSFAVNFIKQSSTPSALRILQKILGHSHIQTTMAYLDYVPMDQKEELNKISF